MPINVSANCHWRRVRRSRLKRGRYWDSGSWSFVAPGVSLPPEEAVCALSSPDCGKFVSIIRFYRQTILTEPTLAVLLHCANGSGGRRASAWDASPLVALQVQTKALLASSVAPQAKPVEMLAKPEVSEQAAKPAPAFWRGASRRMRDPLYPHRPRKGRGRGPLRRLASLAGIAGIVAALGLLLAAFVVLCAVIGGFLVETIIGS